ncbi:protein-methionine-sulfoxide reductase catalytic subunit MsrP [Neptuniibacter sp. CAU 1671]|uniref:protein-methionine-sulfoxide reductase catalytic subunit MsrP n=1 Tax=Neptuniibacter sp. CAU 1671 TaxID=3032593 RepID=UPI0023DC9AEE|nr:protein-methionine-sulfoxide reductase catalytic subunit MsrP [Neptuniibacter sp. CAU 1671]MDF2182358.1 protein-methionine-sulfoxide reductase catalytic subunit MsrP [Neptuniibacter sp. CAU 1671]
MLIKKPDSIPSSEITSESVYLQRRQFMRGVGGLMLGGMSGLAHAVPEYPIDADLPRYPGPAWLQPQIRSSVRNNDYSTSETPAPYFNAITHNNFYEFGTAKKNPAQYAQEFKTDPWKVEIAGAVNKPGHYHLEDVIKPHLLEERIYRLRCVEAWSMVIPWIGVPLAEVLKAFEPTSKAKYVAFTTLLDPEQMPGQRSYFSTIRWPYVEGLRLDEARHPLTLLAVGVYGNALPPQNGAPIRLVVPWKYGFKSIKSIVKISLEEEMPPTSWNLTAPNEYGFYANVNPKVDHPRWSQATERRLPSSLLDPNRIETTLFNGYAEEVAGLYKGMDLKKWY